ncbi:hypothetical protein [Pararhodonellum marinum]|uniref:hypothetical protein n=1 Tax=Pararhodonellum marinum TaxID=2755358 RepID=UPI00189005AA|nr:hypothetical protein [Pararhodonellum marinum]
MGHKKVCIECKMAFSRPFDSGSELQYLCPECGKPMILLPHRFRPPKKADDKKWETVKYLIENGFHYQHVFKELETKNKLSADHYYVAYPENIRDAEEFVKKYKSQARK